MEAAGTAPASAEHHLGACYECSRQSQISAVRIGRSAGHVTGATPSCLMSPQSQGSCPGVSPLVEAAVRVAGCPVRLPYTLLSGKGELMIGVRTYCVPGSFNEANPESSTRYIETTRSTSKLVRPLAAASSLAAESTSEARAHVRSALVAGCPGPGQARA